VLTEQEKEDLHIFVTELQDRNLACDWLTLGMLAEATGDEWEKLVRECLAQWGGFGPQHPQPGEKL
jgi:hypothetical protein